MMRILLTGSSGFLGRHILASPASAGISFRCATRAESSRPDRDIVLGPGPWGRTEFEHALAVSRPDVVIHCAGATHGEARLLFEANAVPTAGLLAALSGMANPPRTILLGSAAEYGYVSNDAMPVREDHPCQPRSDYGISKYTQTLLGLAAAERGLPVMVARLFNPVGLGMPPKLALPSFARRIVKASGTDGVIKVGNLEVSRDFIDVREAAHLLIALACARHWCWPILNLCSGHAFRLDVLLNSMITACGKRIDVQVDPELLRSDDMPLLVGSTERLLAVGLAPEPPDFESLLPQILADAENACH
ncbi:NAD-dependent epimerase/dehydratase family protein [Microvirga aerilata]|uniref:NAD-dependent epimerase/dehydratase family protein n=2 Tax=Microvirga aerilata TaxID=670292 RepID=A0A937CZS9_9HYPH|nr:NAD-dependent epimerase/dehydratase family protein [Microvirga aerilata]MBL0405061.1 NAD-dependent epimerase/dehydratase family protein [Microvirga aerilata]